MKSLYLGLLLTILLLPFSAVNSASLYIDPARVEIQKGDSITLSVRLDTDEIAGECINSVDAVINYSGSINPVDVSVGNSIFNLWVEEPTINTEEKTITFAGGIPNGYCGRVEGDPRLTNNLVQLIFRAPTFSVVSPGSSDSNIASINFGNQTNAYLNDGLGTRADLQTYGTEIEVSENTDSSLQNDWNDFVDQDQTPPEEFSISLERDSSTFRGKYYIVFNTTDKQTGIDEYQVMEEPLSEFTAFTWGRSDAPWVTARSPYKLDDQSLNSTIRVRAIDKAGNQYVATLVPDESLSGWSTEKILSTILFSVIFLVLIGATFIAVKIYRRKTSKKNEELEELYDYDSDSDYDDN